MHSIQASQKEPDTATAHVATQTRELHLRARGPSAVRLDLQLQLLPVPATQRSRQTRERKQAAVLPAHSVMSVHYQDKEQFYATNEQPASTSPSPARRDLTEDAHDNFTRKRQRLDDGGVVLRAMSTDPDSPSRAITSPHKEMVAMTIREHSPPSPSPTADPERETVTADSSDHHLEVQDSEVASMQSVAMLDGAIDDSVSPPVIEIMDDEEDDLSASITVQLSAGDFFRQFPYHQRFGDALRALHAIIAHVQKSMSILSLTLLIAYTVQIKTSLTTSFPRCLDGFRASQTILRAI